MNRTKLIAISGLCAAAATLSLLASGLPGMNWFMLIFAVIAAIAVCIPIFVADSLVFSLLSWLVSAIIGLLLGSANIVYTAPTALFFMPCAIVKAYGETIKLNAEVKNEQTLADPFAEGEGQRLVAIELSGKQRLPAAIKWALYYVLLEIGICLTLLFTSLLMPAVFEQITGNSMFWGLLAALQLLPIPYDVLLRGCFVATKKIIRRALPK